MKDLRRARAVILFSVAFAFVESSVVVYLRDIYYPQGFSLPLVPISPSHLLVELLREASTIIMLAAAGWLAGQTRWMRIAWFMIAFGVWDIFYYVWLYIFLKWPASLFDWDILFLIPIPWIGPVIAPLLISILLIVAGALIMMREETEGFHATKTSWWLAIGGTGCILFSFMRDTGATMELSSPQPYWYWLLFSGLALYIAGIVSTLYHGRSTERGVSE